MCFTELVLGWPYHDLSCLEIETRDVLQGKRNIDALTPIHFANHEDFVGAGLERIFDGADDLPSFVHRNQSNQVSHIELALFRRVEFITVEQELLALQGARLRPSPHTFYINKEPLGRLPDGGDTASRACDNGLDPYPQMSTGSDGAHLQGAAHPVPCDDDPDSDRVEEPENWDFVPIKPGSGSGISRLPTPHSLLPGREAALQSGTSTETRLPCLTEAALTTVRIALIVRPCRPITRPMSPSATLSSRSTRESVSVPETSTLSGSSTSERARTTSKFSSCSMAG